MHVTKAEDTDTQAWFNVKAPYTVGQLVRKEMVDAVQSLGTVSYPIPLRQVFVESPRQLSPGQVPMLHDV